MQDFITDPTTRPHPDCLQTLAVQPYYTQRDFLHLPLLAGGVSGGLQGMGQAIPKLFWITVPSIMLVLAGLVYGMAFLIRRWRGRQTPGQPSGRAWVDVFSHLAPWFAAGTGVSGIIFLVVLVWSVVSGARENTFFLMLGVIRSHYLWVFVMPLLIAVAVVLMVMSCLALWSSRQRSLASRMAYAVLTLLGIVCVLALSSAGFFSYWWS
jgi:uncharacterized membrane protein YhaH (DUF805 family)